MLDLALHVAEAWPMPQSFKAIEWKNGTVVMLDQRLLPNQETYNTYHDAEGIAAAIRSMVIRGAPAIACAASMGLALEARNAAPRGREAVIQSFDIAKGLLAATRPTAVNLFWAIQRFERVLEDNPDADGTELAHIFKEEALAVVQEDDAANRRMGRFGAALLPNRVTILTHCNTGALATGGYGTALGVIRAAVEEGKTVNVYADETRPWLQGARLTAWELDRDSIDVTVIPDSQAGALMKMGEIDAAIVGADRIAANGDTANKIGTYTVAVLCEKHGIPFYVAAPLSTVDFDTAQGDAIPIEERPEQEVTTIAGERFVPAGVQARNIAFDVTPAELITAIITEEGVARPPFTQSLKAIARESASTDE